MVYNQFKELGYFTAKDVFDVSFIRNLKSLCDFQLDLNGTNGAFGVMQVNALNESPFISQIFHSDKFKYYISEILRVKNWRPTNHLDIQRGLLSGWHKDDGTLQFENGKFVQKKGYFRQHTYHMQNVGVIKAAIYLQDHINFNDGLCLIPESHRVKTCNSGGNQIPLQTTAGDVIFFDPRLDHTGQIEPIPNALNNEGKLIKDSLQSEAIKIKENPQIDEIRKKELLKSLFEKINGKKNAVFLTLSDNSELSKIFAIENMKRQLLQLKASNKKAYLPPLTRNILNNFGIKNLIDDDEMWKEAFPI